MKNLYTINYKTLLKDIKEKLLNIWKHIVYSWIERNNIVKMSHCPKQSTHSTQYPTTFQQTFSQKGKADTKIDMELQGASNCQNNLEKE